VIIPKEMVSRYCDILVPGVSVMEIRIKNITPEEVIGEYRDGEEVHIGHPSIVAWWPDPKRDRQSMKAKQAAKNRKEKKEKDEEKEEEVPDEE